MKSTYASIAIVLTVTLAAGASAFAGREFSATTQAGEQIVWNSNNQWASVHLRISGPTIEPFETDFSSSEAVALPLNGPAGRFPDGVYNWELTGTPIAKMAKTRAADDKAAGGLNETASPVRDAVTSGTFTISNGNLVKAGEAEPRPKPTRNKAAAPSVASAAKPESAAKPASAAPTPNPITPDDQVAADDFIVQGSLGVGLDSTDGENFGFSTILLRENNTRITFDDTSTSAGFAANDWQLTANDSASGGQNYFSIDDITGGTTPFKVLAGAPTSSLFVDSLGKIGLGTSTPGLRLHLTQGDTPALRLEQNASGGFSAQTWDIGANEANFFVRDLTGGSHLPFRVRPGAPTSSVDIAASGNVGIGTALPTSSLHVVRSDGTAALAVEEASSTMAVRDLISLRNNGPAVVKYVNTGAANDAGGGGWEAGASNGLTFAMRPVNPLPGVVEFKLQRGGQLTISGPMYATSFNTTSDRNLKEHVVPVAPRDVLQRVVDMPIAEWNFIGEETPGRHIGPMAQDFREQFGLGSSDTTINVMDSAGVALAAIQGLHEEVASRDAEIKTLREKSDSLAAQLQTLSQQVDALKKDQPAANRASGL